MNEVRSASRVASPSQPSFHGICARRFAPDKRQSWVGTLSALVLALIFVNFPNSVHAADLDVDYLTCDTPSFPSPALASHLLDGLSVEQLKHDAFWETKNDAMAHLRHRVLGERYEHGQGVERDLAEAVRQYRQAAFTSGPSSASYSPPFGSTGGSVSVISPGGKVAGDPIAVQRLGEMYRDGIGMPADPKRAQILLDCAAKLLPSTAAASPSRSSFFDQFTKPSPTAVPKVGAAMLNHEIAGFSFPSPVVGIAWSPDGKYLAISYHGDRRITLIDVANGSKLWTAEKLDGRSQAPRKMVFSPDGARLYTGSAITYYKKDRDKTVSVLSARDGQILKTFGYHTPPAGYAMALDIAISQTGTTIYTIPGLTNEVIAYDSDSGNLREKYVSKDDWHETGKGFGYGHVAVDDERDRLWFAHEGTVQFWSLKGGELVGEVQAFKLSTTAMHVNGATGDLIAGGSANISQSRYPTNDPNGEIRTYEDDPHTLVRAFDVATGKLKRIYIGGGGSVEGLSVSPDGSLIAAAKSRLIGREPAYLLLWNANNGDLLAARNLSSADVGDVAFSPDGELLAYVDGDRAKIIDLTLVK